MPAAKKSRSSVPKATPTRQPKTVERQPPTNDEIAMRAYELFIQRGGEHGHDIEDWLLAQRELFATL